MGRRKGSKNKKYKIKKVFKKSTGHRGRPKGSKNKKYKTKKSIKKGTGKRGRPKGSKNKHKNHTFTESYGHTKAIEKMFAVPKDYVIPPAKKFHGYCPQCKFIIGTHDIIKDTYACPGCNKKGKIKSLVQTFINNDKPKTKKEYLEDTVFNTRFVNDYEAGPKEAKEPKEEKEVVEKDEKDDVIEVTGEIEAPDVVELTPEEIKKLKADE